MATVVAVCLGGARASAGEPEECVKGKLCRLGSAKPSAFTVGRVDGGAIWKSGDFATVRFTTTTRAPDVYQIAVCGAAKVEQVKFETKGAFKDTAVASPKGKLSGCDSYELRTGGHYDGLRIKPQGNTFKLSVRRNGKASGYSIFLSGGVLPGREGQYHFKMK